MNEIYWITRLDGINAVALIAAIISLITFAVSIVGFSIVKGELSYYNRRESEYKGRYQGEIAEWNGYKITWKNILKISVPILVLSVITKIFVPTTNEAFVIYGVGGTIDYVKSNPVAKQLPDKCVNALDKWVDSWAVERRDSISY